MATVQFRLNGSPKTLQIDDLDTPLLYVLRNDCDLTGAHFGCGLAQCGACTVQVAGKAVRSCSLPLAAAVGRPARHERPPAARMTAWMTRAWLPHRHRLPASACLIWASVGDLFESSSAFACMIMPLMQ